MIDFWLILASKIDEKSMKNRSKNKSKIRCDLGSIFDGSWMGFGRDLEAKLGPSWSQVGTKIDQKSKSEKACNKDGVRELLNVKILGQSEAWELLNVKILKNIRPHTFRTVAVGSMRGIKTPQVLM